MRYLSLCSGIEAATLAWAPLGWEAVAFAEVDPFACALLEHYYPAVPNLGDISRVTEGDVAKLGPIDVVVFGFPCQDLSVAGKRKGLKGERSGLFYDAMRIVRWTRARWTVVENVPGLFTTHGGRDFACVVGELAGAEFGVPRDGWLTSGAAVGEEGMVEWSVLDAQWFGLAQRRKRVFLVRDTGDWFDRAPVLLEPESLRGDPAPSREARQRTAPTLDARTDGGGAGWGTDFMCDGGVVPELAASLRTRRPSEGGQASDAEQCIIANTLNAHTGIKAPDYANYVAHTLTGRSAVEEDGTERGVPLVPETAGALTAKNPTAMGAPEVDGGHYIPEWPAEVAPSLTCAYAQKWGLEDQHIDGGAGLFVLSSGQGGASVDENLSPALHCQHYEHPIVIGEKAVTDGPTHALRAEGFDASEDGTGRGIPLVVGALNDGAHMGGGANGQDAYSGRIIPVFAAELADPVCSNEQRTYTHEGCTFRTRNVIAFDTTQITHPDNRSQCNPGDPCHTLPVSAHAPAVAFQTRIGRNGRGYEEEVVPALNGADAGATSDMRPCVAFSCKDHGADVGELAPTLRSVNEQDGNANAGGQLAVASSAQVRRLTPRECEILQGVPPDFTRVPYRGKPASDGPRYKSLGNSFAVPVVRWIGERIQKADE